MTAVRDDPDDLAMRLLSSLRIEDGRTWGEAAEPFQVEDARAILADDAPGVSFHFLTRARGASKTTDLAAMCVVELVRRSDGRLYALAADRDQGAILLDAVAGFVNRTPGLREHLRVDAWRVTCPRTRSTLAVLAADAPGAWGLRPTFVVVDEFAAWAETRSARLLWEAVATAVPKVPGCRLVILTTAGDPSHSSKKVLDRAKADPAWRVHEVVGPAPWTSPEALAAQERMHLPSTFRRRFMNEWTVGEDRLALPADVRACVTLDGPVEPQRGRRYVVGLDLGIKRDRSVAAVCHLDDRIVVLDRMMTWSGTRETPVRLQHVEDWLAEAHRTYVGARVVFDPWQAVGLAQRLADRRVHVREFPFTAQSVGRLAVTLFNAIGDHSLAIPPDEELVDELCSVRLRETSPGVVRLDHDADRHDDRAVALALAVHALIERPPPRSRTSGLRDLVAANASLAGAGSWNPDRVPSPRSGFAVVGRDGAWEERSY
ncbi:MAG: terminase large subunit domain-containing protein [Actinomycetota bacterium]